MMSRTTDDLVTFSDGVDAANSPISLWALILDFVHDRDFPMISYHHLDLARRTDPAANPTIVADGFPDDWICSYIDQKLFLIDPIPEFAERRHAPFRWSELEELTQLTEAERRFLDRRRASGVGDGIAIQVFGPHQRNGCFGIGFGDRTREASAQEIRELQIACQLAHLRYCAMVEVEAKPDHGLSTRESEILQWIAKGKSNASIAGILGISNHTVDTHVRRIFAKLGAADRVTAAIRGIGSGLIRGIA